VRTAALTLVGTFVLAGCASGPGEPPGPVVSPTGIVYESGTPPEATRYSQTATLYLRSDQPERALALVQEGLEAHPGNPIHHFLAGVALARLDRHAEADEQFRRAEAIYPAYQLDIEPEREAAWGEAFNRGVEAYAAGRVEEAMEAWRGAARIFDLRPEAHRNLAMLLTEQGRYEEAADIYQEALAGLQGRPVTRVLDEEELEARQARRRVLEQAMSGVLLLTGRFEEAEPILRRQLERDPGNVDLRQNLAAAVAQQGRREEARRIYDELLSESELEATVLQNLGVALFRSGEYDLAAEAFEQLTRTRPQSRDAWFNYANALFAAEAWEALARVGDRLLEVDPLSENALLIWARAHLELGDEDAAVRGLQRLEAAPIYLEGLILRPAEGGTSVDGRVVGNVPEVEAPLRLRFVFYGEDGEIGAEVLSLETPPPGESTAFEIVFEARATHYRYEVLE
jgi:tetratricopeptide (TPR) repeat protein